MSSPKSTRWADWLAMAPSENFVKYRSKRCYAVVAAVVAAVDVAAADAVAIVEHEPVANCVVQSLDHYSIGVSANSDLRPNPD